MSHKSVADEIDPVTAAELGHPHHQQQQQHPLHHRHQQHNTPPPIQQSVMSAAADEVLGSISGTIPESTDIAADHQQKLMNDDKNNKLAIDAEKVVAHVRARGTEAAAPDVQTPIDSNNNSNSRDEEVGQVGLKTATTVMMTVVAAKQEKDALLGEVDIKDVAEVVTFPNNGSPAVGHGMETTTTTTTSTKASPPTTTTTTTTRRRVFVADDGDAKEEQDKERKKNEEGECSGKTDDKAVQCNSAEESAIMLQDWKEMPRYLQFNPYVLTGYRPLQNVSECFASLFYFHNETFNILTHGE